jgi:hypothetical protein
MSIEIQKLETIKQRRKEKNLQARSCRQKTHLCCGDPLSSRLAFWWQIGLSIAVMFSIFALFWESWALLPAHDPGHPTKFFFDSVELLLSFVFTGELLTRFIVNPIKWSSGSGLKKIRAYDDVDMVLDIDDHDIEMPFFKDFLNYLDLVAIFPTFLGASDLFVPQGPPSKFTEFDVFVNFLKVTRAVRLYKIFRAHSGTKILWKTIQGSSRPILVILPVLAAFLMVGGPLILILEPCLSPDCAFKDSFNAGYFLTITL